MLRSFFSKIKDWMVSMFTKDEISKILDVNISMSAVMEQKLFKWRNMYADKPSWKGEDNGFVKTLNLPAVISAKIAGNVTSEMKLTIEGSARAVFLQEQIAPLVDNVTIQRITEKAQALGGVVIQPYVKDGEIAYNISEADEHFPVAFDASENLVACVFVDRRQFKNQYFTRLEYHRFEGDTYVITNTAFRSATASHIGMKVGLDALEEWKDIEEEVAIEDLEYPLFGYYKTPVANNIDTGSPIGMSAFSKAEDLIEQADRHWSNFLWEFESGKRAMYVDETALKRTTDTNLPYMGLERLYRRISGTSNIGDANKLFEDWTPTLRQVELLDGLDAILKRIELNCGLAFGALVTNPDRVEKTATEMQIHRQETFLTIINNQKNLQSALLRVVEAADALTTLYQLAPDGVYEPAFEFDDSIIVDKDKQFTQDMQTKNGGMMPKQVFLVRNYKLSEEQAKEWLSMQTEEAKADLELLGGFGPDNSNKGF